MDPSLQQTTTLGLLKYYIMNHCSEKFNRKVEFEQRQGEFKVKVKEKLAKEKVKKDVKKLGQSIILFILLI